MLWVSTLRVMNLIPLGSLLCDLLGSSDVRSLYCDSVTPSVPNERETGKVDSARPLLLCTMV